MTRLSQIIRYAIAVLVPAAATWLGLDETGRQELLAALGSIVANVAAAYAAILGIWAGAKALHKLYKRTRGSA